MSRRRVLLLILSIIVLLAAAATVWFALPRKTRLTIAVTGSPELSIKATCEVDGQPQEVTFTGPNEFALEGYRVIYSLVSTDESGQFRLKAHVGERTYGAGGSGDPPNNGVRGWVKSSWWGAPPASWFEAFNRDEKPNWLNPPP